MLNFCAEISTSIVVGCMYLCVILWSIVGVLKAANVLNDIKGSAIAKWMLILILLGPIIAYFIR